jgi:bis(5'-nucleosidyl)-tetraphosphatase
MKVERSAGAVIFRKEKRKILYLMLKYGSAKHWDFSKGHIEKGEKTIKAAKREIKEETGIADCRFVKGFKETIKYFFKWPPKDKLPKNKKQDWRLKFVVFFLVETKTKAIKISYEHSDFEWLEYEDALRRLTHKTAKNVLKSAHGFLSSLRQ